MILKYEVSAHTHDRCDFRGASWGMSKTEVKCSEGIVPHSEGEGYITYRERVMGLDAVVGFHFMGDSLVEAGYAFREPIGDESVYLCEYEKVKGIITRSYGLPSFDEDACDDGCECYIQCDMVPGAGRDSLVYLSEWLTLRSIIRLILMGEEGGFDFGVLHRSRELMPLIERRTKNVEAGD
jgi:hypothetical protein